MSKQNEIDYLSKLSQESYSVTLGKPFTETGCSRYLMDMGQIISLFPVPPSSIIDFGCGTGWTSYFFALRGYKVTGLDIAPDMIRIAEGQYHLPNLSFKCGDYEKSVFAEGFDIAIFYDSLHHAEDEKKALECAYRVLGKGGLIVLAEPGKGHHTSEPTIQAIEKYGVTEKDMPPSHVAPIMKNIGFRDFKLIPRIGLIHKLLEDGSALKKSYKLYRCFSYLKDSAIVTAIKD